MHRNVMSLRHKALDLYMYNELNTLFYILFDVAALHCIKIYILRDYIFLLHQLQVPSSILFQELHL